MKFFICFNKYMFQFFLEKFLCNAKFLKYYDTK